MRQAASILKNALLFLSVLLLAFACAEIFTRYFLFSAADRAKGAELLWRSHRNLYSSEHGASHGRCALADTIVPNPYLEYSHDPDSRCGPPHINNIGVSDLRKFPIKKDTSSFSILMVGASVAEQLANGPGPAAEQNWLEAKLNDLYISPNGKPFRIYNGAVGGWHYPNQLTMLNLYGDSLDAVVALDGFNEAERVAANVPIYFSDPIGYTAAIRSLRYPISTVAIFLTGDLRTLSLGSSVTAKSFFLYGVFMSSINFLASHGEIQENELRKVRKFDFPATYSAQESMEANTKKYSNYIELLAASARVLKLNYAHFVQPNRLLGKILTQDEKQFAQTSSGEIYRSAIVEPSLKLIAKGLNTFPLTTIYEKENGTIYRDNIHCAYQGPRMNRGYELMADAMAHKISEFWHLKKRKTLRQ